MDIETITFEECKEGFEKEIKETLENNPKNTPVSSLNAIYKSLTGHEKLILACKFCSVLGGLNK